LSAGEQQGSGKSAAFFDVDGTLAKTTIVHFYIYFRKRRMSPIIGKAWEMLFLIKCVYYLVLDKINRSRLNIVFYRSYRGMNAAYVRGLAGDCHHDVFLPRLFREAPDCVAAHREAGRPVVFVTGSIDFIMAPVVEAFHATDMLARTLVEENGSFTGALDGPPVGDEEKARLMRHYAAEHDIDLSASYAFGDSIADLPMLETVGHPQVVNPDRTLESVARSRGWPIHRWTTSTETDGNRR